jgi:hypothetical protein
MPPCSQVGRSPRLLTSSHQWRGKLIESAKNASVLRPSFTRSRRLLMLERRAKSSKAEPGAGTKYRCADCSTGSGGAASGSRRSFGTLWLTVHLAPPLWRGIFVALCKFEPKAHLRIYRCSGGGDRPPSPHQRSPSSLFIFDSTLGEFCWRASRKAPRSAGGGAFCVSNGRFEVRATFAENGTTAVVRQHLMRRPPIGGPYPLRSRG